MLENGTISVISNFRYNVWKNNAAETLIFIYKKGVQAITKIIHPKDQKEFLRREGFSSASQKNWLETPGCRFIIRGDNQIMGKISADTTPLGSVADVSQGIIIYKTREQSKENLYISETFKDGWVKLLDGKSRLIEYRIDWGGNYLKYGTWLWCPRDDRFFKNPKILFIRLRNKSLRRKLIGAYDSESYYNRDNFNNIIQKDFRFPLKYILALFNSDVLNYWYKSIFDNVNINPEQVRLLPLKCADEATKSVLCQLVDWIQFVVKINSERLLLCFLKELINGIVYELYFADKIKAAGKEILKYLDHLKPITDHMTDVEKLAVIRSEFDRLYDPYHPVRNNLETLDSLDVVRTINKEIK
ncbi:MAG: hypothetical protein NT166_11535 [Candidatus Aminicenantes bacterium]|nr:hypothetical protein [Candidatus Aminicenantes bacterium]